MVRDIYEMSRPNEPQPRRVVVSAIETEEKKNNYHNEIWCVCVCMWIRLELPDIVPH